jgi:hypothetical protein
MPQIIVTAGAVGGEEEGTVTLSERINITDFESERFTANLLERLGWAVSDATEVERCVPNPEDREAVPEPTTPESETAPDRNDVPDLVGA